jgi:hypothetical protein
MNHRVDAIARELVLSLREPAILVDLRKVNEVGNDALALSIYKLVAIGYFICACYM